VRGPSSKSNTRQKGSQRSHRSRPVHIPHSNLHHPHSPPKDPASPPYRHRRVCEAHLCVLIDPFGHLTIDGRVAIPAKNTPYAAERRSSRRRFINTASGVPVFQCSRKLRSILPPDFSYPSLISASVIEPTPNAAGCAHPSPPSSHLRVSHLSTQPAHSVSVCPSFSWSTWECACDSHKGTTAERTSFYFSPLFICFSVHSGVALRCLACSLAHYLIL
jgi:hypothetical protein